MSRQMKGADPHPSWMLLSQILPVGGLKLLEFGIRCCIFYKKKGSDPYNLFFFLEFFLRNAQLEKTEMGLPLAKLWKMG